MQKLPLFILVWLVALHGTQLIAQASRTIDGVGNNVNHPEWGSAGGEVIHDVPVAFEDGISEPCRPDGMNARQLSNKLFHQSTPLFNASDLSDFVWAFGQFIDHDIVLIENFDSRFAQEESVSVVVPPDDTIMTPGKIIPIMRSRERAGSGTGMNNPRTYDNEITAFVDASTVYGSDKERADWLRAFEGGKLKTSAGNRLPWNTIDGEFGSLIDVDAPHMADDVGLSAKLFVAGDVRANENPLLAGLHLLFVREHNRLCDQWLMEDPSLDPSSPQTDEELYQRARSLVSGIIQNIVYNEWLPSIGIELPVYEGYNENVNPSITNAFSAAIFRWGHTMINDNILRVDQDGETIASGNVGLRDAFFNPIESLRFDLEYYLKGMGIQKQQSRDCRLVSSVRNFLFEGNPILGGLDLAAINIERGRERGLPDYNNLRIYYGLEPLMSFEQIAANPTDVPVLEEIYGDVWKLDPWVGMLAEPSTDQSVFGELIVTGMREQFRALRDGDRYYYLNDEGITSTDLDLIKASTFASVILRNTHLECFQDNVFEATDHQNIPCFPYVSPSDLRVSLAPNPVQDFTFISLYSSKEDKATLRVVNELGQEMSLQEVVLQQGTNQIRLDMSHILKPGPYYIVMERGYDLISLKVLKI